MNPTEIVGYKENIQPLRHGRDASKLCAGLLAQTDSELDKALQAQRLEYEALVRDESIEDALSVWYEYVYWLEQTFPSQSTKTKIQTILKKCINKFKTNNNYTNDERFVKLCLKYASMTTDTGATIALVWQNGIGKKSAILYIAWAEQFALTNSFKEAAKIYKRGIDELAQPIDMLKAAQSKFEAFLVRKMLNNGELFQPDRELYEQGPVRQAYNKIKTLSVRGTDVVPSVRVGENVAPAGKYRSGVKPTQKGGQFAIYQDRAGEEDSAVSSLTKSHKLKSESVMNKENTKKAGKWTNPENVPFAVPQVSLPFQVHVDDEAASQPVAPSASLTSALKPKQADEFNDNFTDTPLFISEPYDPKVRPMYRKEQVYAGGLEFQFEELRAIQYRKRLEKLPPAREEDRKCTEQPSTTKSRPPCESARKSLKIKTSDEARSARRRIAVVGAGDDTDRRQHSARKSNFGGVVRRTLVLDQKDAAKPNLPSDSFINQTIHTKEAVDVMQELWFAKPASPPKAKPAPAPVSAFNFYVDESCLEKLPGDDALPASGGGSERGKATRERLRLPLCVADENDENKENALPVNYAGHTGKSTRPVTGILTPSENVVLPVVEEEEDDDSATSSSPPEMPCNTTGITETWNFTQAFQFPRIAHASTPNVRRSLYRPPNHHEQSYVGGDQENRTPQEDQPVDLKVSSTAPAAAPAFNQPSQDMNHKEVGTDARKSLFRTMASEQRTIGGNDKNLSIIVETSREYKSSSSGSGTSNYCSKLLPFTPGPGESRYDVKRLHSFSQAEESRKTPFAYKTQSTYGYEASAELSCISTKPSFDEVVRQVTNRLALCDDREKSTESIMDTPALQNNGDQPEILDNEQSKLKEGVTRMTIAAKSFELGESWCVRDKTAPLDIDPFDSHLTDSLLEQMNFPTAHHATGCHFQYSKLPALKIHSKVPLGESGSWNLKMVLGEGAYAKVFKAQNAATGEMKVFKYQKPAFPWEFYIAREIRARCTSPAMMSLFTNIEAGYFFENASLLVSSPVEYGDLLSAINLYKVNQGKPMSDYLALYFSIQILEIIEVLHSLHIIHGDIKPDNFLLKRLDGKLCLELIDFGRSIDMTKFPDGTCFTRVVTTDGFTCIEMQTGRKWTYQLDLYGVAGCVHCLLFGDYMKVIQKGNCWEIAKNIPRYLAKSGWKDLFQALLNIPSCTELPNLSFLRSNMFAKLEAYGAQPDLIKLSNFLDNH